MLTETYTHPRLGDISMMCFYDISMTFLGCVTVYFSLRRYSPLFTCQFQVGYIPISWSVSLLGRCSASHKICVKFIDRYYYHCGCWSCFCYQWWWSLCGVNGSSTVFVPIAVVVIVMGRAVDLVGFVFVYRMLLSMFLLLLSSWVFLVLL